MQVYEQIRPDTMFGRQMIRNLEERGAPLYGVHATPTLEAHKQRLTRCGWQRALAEDLISVYSCVIEPEDRMRVEALEMFDEFEEWHLIMGHYCAAVGVNDSAGILHGLGFKHHGSTQAAARNLLGERRNVPAAHLPDAD
jgi:tRNA wybutosine-synthesizing protein 4